MSPGKAWQDDGGEIMYKVPSGSGDRAIVSHLGSAETGLLDGCLLLYNDAKSNNNADYHSEMNASVFLDWLLKKVFPRMKEFGKTCVLVLDRATYHTRLTPHTNRMRKSYTKPELVDALERWDGIPDEWPSNWRQSKTKAQLFSRCEAVTPPPKYLAQELADKFKNGDFSIKILMLPVAHAELNPIEHVWGIVKRTVASHNFTHNLKEVERLTKMQIRSFTGPHGSRPNRTFGKFVPNTKEEEERYRRLAAEMDVEDDRNRVIRRRAMTAVTLTTTTITVKTMSVISTMSSCFLLWPQSIFCAFA
jgi:DDE superfamily endonuclease